MKGEGMWDLDKWKFLPMLQTSLQKVRDDERDGADRKMWFMVMEADTFISLHNLLLWIRELDAEEVVYAGAQIFIGDTEFAHGGSGILLSRKAVELAVQTYGADFAKWENFVADSCCGDKVLADVLVEAGVHLLRSWPMMQGETVWSLDWRDVGWCRPAISWHHVASGEVEAMWAFERRWAEENGLGVPILFRDYFEGRVKGVLKVEMADWDNMSEDWVSDRERVLEYERSEQKNSMLDKTNCENLCMREEACVQWVWRPGRCAMSRALKLGKEDHGREENGRRIMRGFVSGWPSKRVEEALHAMGWCDEHKRWITKNEA